MATCGKRRDLPALKVVDADWALFTSSEGGDNTTQGSGALEERQKVDGETIAGVDY